MQKVKQIVKQNGEFANFQEKDRKRKSDSEPPGIRTLNLLIKSQLLYR